MGAADDTAQEILGAADEVLSGLVGQRVDILSIRKPVGEEEARGWVEIANNIFSKVSPLVGNMLEFEIVRMLNARLPLPTGVRWERQDPGFPDAGLMGLVLPPPGIEVKVWYPFATEITGRFKESQDRLRGNDVRVAVLAWLPEYVVFGAPVIIGVFVEDAMSFAVARDTHYHNPPQYLVVEPGNTTERTVNLQQTNTNGFRLQDVDPDTLERAEREVADAALGIYSSDSDFQEAIAGLMARYSYRGDTNYAKIDRIEHPGLEAFKADMMALEYQGMTIAEWRRLLAKEPASAVEHIVRLAAAAP